jgi:histidyl-tRNA synthetase
VSDQEKAAKRAQWEEINRAKAAAKQKDQSAAEKAQSRASVTHKQFQAIRGTRDLLPPDTALWNRVEQTAHEVFTTYGFGEIRPPIFESTELFARGVGGDTDIVGKEMYTFEEKSDPRLEQYKYILSAKPPEPNASMIGYLHDLRIVLPELRTASSLGDLRDTETNRRSIENLTILLKELEDHSSGKKHLEERELVRKFSGVRQIGENLETGERISLRPEATASVCRAYLEHSMQQMPQPVKLYYMGPMFRRERPQKGRYRQFYQIGAEILGGLDAPAIDAELIEMLMTFFAKLGLEGTTLDINSIGHAADNCRRGYVAKLREELLKVKDKLGADSQRRIETNPLRVLDSKLEHEQAIIATLPRIADHLCDECKTHYAAVKRDLDLRGVAYRENWRLVRGLDYYMRTTFEITARGLGSQNAVCGGGRYDGLVELLGGPPTKGIGFAIGEDRLILSLQEGGKAPAAQGPDVFIAWMGQNAYGTAIRAAKTLRNAGLRVELPATELKFGKALERASKLGSRFALILGDNEIQSGEWTLKNLATSEQQKLSEQALLEYLRR